MTRVSHARLWRGLFCALILLCLPVLASAQTAWVWREAGQYGIWSYDGIDRFQYDYSGQQWWDYTTFGEWQKLGGVGASPVTREQGLDFEHFIGNGTWRDLLTGWQYLFDTSYNGCSLWRDNTDPFRFSYCYTTGQWNDFSWYTSGYWTGLGTQGRSQIFIGDGGWYNLGTGWQYQYVTSPTMGCSLWRDTTDPFRFSYCYNTGQWNDFSFYTPGYWTGIGLGSMSSAFIGDGNWHDLGNGWQYQYPINNAVAVWRDTSAPLRFSYAYHTGQWNDFSWYTPGYWTGIGLGNMSSAFIGDGEWHALGTGWSYRYRSWLNGYAVWKDADGMQFSYGYLYGQWNDYSPATSTWAGLGSGGLPSVFIGDGQWHELGAINEADWRYAYAEDSGTWQQLIDTTYTDRFQYNYTAGRWYHISRGFDTDWTVLSAAGISSDFVGDGNWRVLDTVGVWLDYRYASNRGDWRVQWTEKVAYAYDTGQWSIYSDPVNIWADLGDPGLPSTFIGDGEWHAIGGVWSFRFRYRTENMFEWADAGTWRFTYDIGQSRWYQYGAEGTGRPALSDYGASPDFVGDGDLHPIGSFGGMPWDYMYAGGVGTWRDHDIGADRFRYDYTLGQWQDNRSDGWHYLGASGLASTFLGDEAPHPLNDSFTYTWQSEDREGRWYLDATHYFKYGYAEEMPGWAYSLDNGITWYPWSQTTYALETTGASAADPAGLTIGAGDGLLYFRAYNEAGKYDLYRWDGSTLTNVSATGFDDFYRSFSISGVGTYFTARHGSEWDVYLYNGSDFLLVSNTAENYSDLETLAYSTGGSVFYGAWNSVNGYEYLYMATGATWTQIPLEAGGFNWLNFATGFPGVDLFFYGNPVGSTKSYVYELHSGGFVKIDNPYSLVPWEDGLQYAGKNYTDLFFKGDYLADGFLVHDVYRLWNDGGTWTFTNISNTGFRLVSDSTGRTLGNDVYFQGGDTNNVRVFRWDGTALAWETVSGPFSTVEWAGAYSVQGSTGCLYFSALDTDSRWAVYRADASTFGQISDYGISDLKHAGTIGTNDYWTATVAGGGYDLFSTSGTTFTRLTTDNFANLQFQTQVGNDLYFAAIALGGDGLLDLYRYNGTAWTKLADTPSLSAEYAAHFPAAFNQPELLIWRGQPGDGYSYFGYYSPTTGAYGQWSDAIASNTWSVSYGLIASFGRDYYFSGALAEGNPYTLMRYWGDYDYLTGRLVD